MTDNQLYNYFKERQHNFEETPGDELWGKIESGLGKKKINPAKLIGIIALLAGAVYSITFFLNIQDTIVPHENIAPVNKQTYSTEIKEAARVVTERSIDTVKKKKAAKKENQDNGIKNIEYKSIVATAPIVTKDIVPDEKQERSFKDTLPGNNIITTLPGKVRIQSLDQLTKVQYDTLVARAVRNYSDQPKSILIIVAKGHKSYRKLIEAALREQNKLQGKAFAPINGSIQFMDTPGDTLRIKEPDISPNTIKFKEKTREKNVPLIDKVEPAQDSTTDEFEP